MTPTNQPTHKRRHAGKGNSVLAVCGWWQTEPQHAHTHTHLQLLGGIEAQLLRGDGTNHWLIRLLPTEAPRHDLRGLCVCVCVCAGQQIAAAGQVRTTGGQVWPVVAKEDVGLLCASTRQHCWHTAPFVGALLALLLSKGCCGCCCLAHQWFFVEQFDDLRQLLLQGQGGGVDWATCSLLLGTRLQLLQCLSTQQPALLHMHRECQNRETSRRAGMNETGAGPLCVHSPAGRLPCP